SLVGEQRNGETLVAAEEHGARDGGRSEPIADVVKGGVESNRARALERERELERTTVLEVGERNSKQRDAATLDHWHGSGEQPPRGGEDRLGLSLRLGQGVRSSRPGEVAEAQPKRDRAAHSWGGPQPAGQAVNEPDEDGVQVGP